tara:strand:- start:786 stop:1631 length:846 start_codon:yes stop_codon:yes gene_type:complete
MSNIPENCIFNEIKMTRQDVNPKYFSELFHNLYNNVIFSTFPYTLYKEQDSETCINKYNSGNCIALSKFIKNYLQNNYKIESYIIAASVPDCFKTLGTPHLTHCAIIIPFSTDEFYIFDAALYFLKPMYCNLKNNIQRTIQMADVYQYSVRNMSYIITTCKDCRLDNNYNQILKPNSLCVSCFFEDDENEKWNYYLNEIINPDNNIGHSFLKHKKEPFMMYTTIVNKIPTMKYKLKLKDDGLMVVKKYPENEVVFNGNSEQFNKTNLRRKLERYLSTDFSF